MTVFAGTLALYGDSDAHDSGMCKDVRCQYLSTFRQCMATPFVQLQTSRLEIQEELSVQCEVDGSWFPASFWTVLVPGGESEGGQAEQHVLLSCSDHSEVHVDSSARMGIMNTFGVGRVRH